MSSSTAKPNHEQTRDACLLLAFMLYLSVIIKANKLDFSLISTYALSYVGFNSFETITQLEHNYAFEAYSTFKDNTITILVS